MRKVTLTVAALLLTASASVGVYAQKESQTTIDAWRQALPTSLQPDTALIVDMAESTNNIEAKETAVQIETRILDLEQKLTEAFNQRDAATLKQLLADDFVPAGANVTQAQAEKNRFIESALKNSEPRTYAVEKTKVRIYSTATVVVTTFFKQRMVVAGVPTDVDFTATDVWLKRKKQWQAVSHHVTELPKTAPTVARPAQANQTP